MEKVVDPYSTNGYGVYAFDHGEFPEKEWDREAKILRILAAIAIMKKCEHVVDLLLSP